MKNFLKCLLVFLGSIAVLSLYTVALLFIEMPYGFVLSLLVFSFLTCIFEGKIKRRLNISTKAYILSVFVCPLILSFLCLGLVFYLDSISYFTDGWFAGLAELIISFLLVFETLTLILIRGVVEIVKRVLKRWQDSSSAGEG